MIFHTYYADPYYRTGAYKDKLESAKRIELARQALMRGEATAQTLAYARFLTAMENAATIGGPGCVHDDAKVCRRYPFLVSMISAEGRS